MERFWSPAIPKVTVGLDLGDRKTELCQLDEQGQVAEQSWVATTRAGVEKRFRDLEPARVVLEAGTHSPWISRMLEAFGHEVIVANPAELYAGKRTRRRKKNDRIDAEFLARQGRADPALLFPIQHRSEETQGDLALIHSRDALVRARASLVNHVRGTVKSVGGRLPASSTPSFARTAGEQIPEVLRPALVPVLEMIQALSEQIVAFDKQIECMAEEKHPATRSLRQVTGVGALTALTYVLVLEDPKRFKRSRSVGSYLGLAPRLEETGGAGRGPASCPSARRVMRCCADSWSAARTTFWVPLVPTRISGAGGSLWPHGVGRTRRSVRWLPSRASWPSCCTACGVPARCMNRCATPASEVHAQAPSPAR